ncbi:polymorphic toxin type 44 domain-containing protein [Erwinia sp. 198]|uniref:polymorphic toxin type 44 domain-containing protein n=1 Tax=Erwinia sp. 198 TaxID=2022746 RepID=UPI000F6592CF|nr:polymorphic toxin type 44 domain-containing protein [Erwinia sp. 198]RRZ91611.1 hypothetical protein EGK14_11825 [Erwinia sp. 198]
MAGSVSGQEAWPRDYKFHHGAQYENFGHFHYGTAGHAAGIKEAVLLRAAGWAQGQAGTSEDKWRHWYNESPYGDDPNDAYWIRAGIDYAKRTGFKKGYVLLIFLVLLISFGAYKTERFSPVERKIIKKSQINRLLNLYVTEVNAGATTAFSYRFYLFDADRNDKSFLDSLNDTKPFLITSDPDAFKKVENNAIYLSVKGHVFSFSNSPAVRINEVIYSAPVYLTSTPF